MGAGGPCVLGLATRVPTRHVMASKLGSATLSSSPWVCEGVHRLGNGSGTLGNDLNRSRWVRPSFVQRLQVLKQWLKWVPRPKKAGFGSISQIAAEREGAPTSNHLIINEDPNAHIPANFRGDRRYKNVQGQLVGSNCTVPRAQVQTGRGVRVSYYMKGKSEGVD